MYSRLQTALSWARPGVVELDGPPIERKHGVYTRASLGASVFTHHREAETVASLGSLDISRFVRPLVNHLVTFVPACMIACTNIASADIGFASAVALSRAAVPQGTLLEITQRLQNDVWIYKGSAYDIGLTVDWGARFDRETGAAMGVDVDSVDQSSLSSLQQIMERIATATIDFADAEVIANTVSGRTDVEKMQFDMEAGVLAFQVEYFDGVTKIYVDSVTGGVIPHHNGDDSIEDTVPSATMLAAITLAEQALGGGWMTIGSESESENVGSVVEVLLLNIKSGMLAQADVVAGAVTTVVEFSPSSSQASKVAKILAALPLIVVSASDAVTATESSYPGAGINEIELEVETEKSGTTVQWKISLVTADLIEVDAFIDATQPIGGGFRYATAPTNFVAGDFNSDGMVNAVDLLEAINMWGAVNPPMDLDHDGVVGAGDLTTILTNWS